MSNSSHKYNSHHLNRQLSHHHNRHHHHLYHYHHNNKHHLHPLQIDNSLLLVHLLLFRVSFIPLMFPVLAPLPTLTPIPIPTPATITTATIIILISARTLIVESIPVLVRTRMIVLGNNHNLRHRMTIPVRDLDLQRLLNEPRLVLKVMRREVVVELVVKVVLPQRILRLLNHNNVREISNNPNDR